MPVCSALSCPEPFGFTQDKLRRRNAAAVIRRGYEACACPELVEGLLLNEITYHIFRTFKKVLP